MMIALRDAGRSAAGSWLEAAYHDWLTEIGTGRVDAGAARATLALLLAAEDIDALLIERGGQPIGFAMVRTLSPGSAVAALPSRGLRRLEDFYVLPAVRRRGVGAAAARLLFDRFDGHWEIVSLQRDVAATQFWRHVLHRYTAGRVTEQRLAGAIRYRFASNGAR